MSNHSNQNKNLEYKNIAFAELKEISEGNGGFEGYANNFGSLDSYGDITVKGCFDWGNNLKVFVEQGWSAPDHDWGVKTEIGIVVDAKEDERGLWVRVEFHPTEDAQNIRKKIKNRIEKGKSVRLSIGYSTVESKQITGIEAVQYLTGADENQIARCKAMPSVRLLLKVKLYEVSPVSVGAEERAAVTSVKGDVMTVENKNSNPSQVEIKGMFEEMLAERTNTLYNLWNVFCSVIYRIQYLYRINEETNGNIDFVTLFDEAVAEFTARVRAVVLKDIKDSEDASYLGNDNFESKDAKIISLAGMTLASHSETVLAAVDELTTRAKAIHELRAKERKEGRTISKENLARMETCKEKIKSCSEAMQKVHDDLDGLCEMAKPKEKENAQKARSIKLELLKSEAESLGVTV